MKGPKNYRKRKTTLPPPQPTSGPNIRFYFTCADEEMSDFIYHKCESLGLMPHEYMRSVIRNLMKK